MEKGNGEKRVKVRCGLCRWSIEKSPTCNPQKNPGILEAYTKEQIEACQIKMVKACFLDSDERFKEIGSYNRIAIFQRIR